MCKLAICVPTLGNRPVVEEVLSYSIDYLTKYGVDIYYYDSGRSSDVKDVIEGFDAKGYSNIFHVPLDRKTSYGEKIDLIYSGYALEKEYEYIWPIKDRVICNEDMLQLVLRRCKAGVDIVISLSLGDIFEEDHIDNVLPMEIYGLFAKQTTSLETVIYNRKTVLGNYAFGDSKTAPKYQNDFWHYRFIYNTLAQMPSPIVSVISKDGAYNMRSSIPQESGWVDRALEVWIDEWVRINYELPDIYSPLKAKAIKDTTSIDELLGNKEIFVTLHERGVLNEKTYEKYKDMWEFVTTVPKEEIKSIALGNA